MFLPDRQRCLYLKNDQIVNREPTFWQENAYCKENMRKCFYYVRNEAVYAYNLLFWSYFSGGIVFKMIYSLANELIAIKFPSGSAT